MAPASKDDSNDDGDPPSGHKLCGYLQAILSVHPPQPPVPLSPCTLFRDGPGNVGFLSETGALLRPVQELLANSGQNQSSEPDAKSPTNTPSSKRRRRSGVVLVNGSMSVVHQLLALVSSRCLKTKARIVNVSAREESEDARAVVLVDVYLPIEAWSGWQFPRQRALAASFFKHVR